MLIKKILILLVTLSYPLFFVLLLFGAAIGGVAQPSSSGEIPIGLMIGGAILLYLGLLYLFIKIFSFRYVPILFIPYILFYIFFIHDMYQNRDKIIEKQICRKKDFCSTHECKTIDQEKILEIKSLHEWRGESGIREAEAIILLYRCLETLPYLSDEERLEYYIRFLKRIRWIFITQKYLKEHGFIK